MYFIIVDFEIDPEQIDGFHSANAPVVAIRTRAPATASGRSMDFIVSSRRR